MKIMKDPPTFGSYHTTNTSGCGCPMPVYSRMTDEKATLQACSGRNWFPSCCGVAQNGRAVQGIRTQSGGCQMSPHQEMMTDGKWPNTFLITTSGPRVRATMGGCTVRPVGSSIQNFVGLFEQCQQRDTNTLYRSSPYGSYGPNYSACN